MMILDVILSFTTLSLPGLIHVHFGGLKMKDRKLILDRQLIDIYLLVFKVEL